MAENNDKQHDVFGVLDAVMPRDMAKRAEYAGTEKAQQNTWTLLALAIMAGAYVAFGATFAAALTAGLGDGAFAGLGSLLGGLGFSLAFVLAIVGGAELFTANVIMIMAWVHGRLSTLWLLRAWALVFIGNFIGAVATGFLLVLAGRHMLSGGAVGEALLMASARIENHTLFEGLLLGVLGNTLLCLGVWLTYSARTTTDRILALTPPVVAFYALGLEHAVAVMFYLPVAYFIEWLAQPAFWEAITMTTEGGPPLAAMLRVLPAVTLGNILGGGVLVGFMYWFVYLQPEKWIDRK